MKLNLKKGLEVDVGIEKLVEKGMEQHDKSWKDKFNTKHNAKKEMIEMKHKQKMEIEEKNKQKRTGFKKLKKKGERQNNLNWKKREGKKKKIKKIEK